MLKDLVVLEGSTFFVSEPSGDVVANADPSGFFHSDTRHLSVWRLLIDGQPVQPLSSSTIAPRWGRVFGMLGATSLDEGARISIRRDRIIGESVHEDLLVENHSRDDVVLSLEMRFATDFADIFEVKGHWSDRSRRVESDVGDDRVTLSYQRDGYSRGTVLEFQQPSSLAADRALFKLKLAPRQSWKTCVKISCVVDGQQREALSECPGEELPSSTFRRTVGEWLEDAPVLYTGHDILRHTYRQSLTDLAALRFRPLGQLSWPLPAAGLPWFMALFGRDSLITAYQVLPFQPEMARSTLEALAALQATELDDFRDAQPGKILHELRFGELTATGKTPHSPYYGTHDATPLFLILLEEYQRWTGDLEFARKMEPAARAALRWMDEYGDLDGDGYLEYQTRSAEGLRNQCWKDSGNSMLFADGRLAEGAIATCEIQGYAYDARLRTARLARLAWDDRELAHRLEGDAQQLRKQFNQDFWVEGRGHYALALDGDKRQVDSLTSNTGHLLWSGIVDEDRAGRVVARLIAPDMFSGWGIRTMSELDAGYSPMEYHNGTVWPHDTAIVAEGMRRYGHTDAAASVMLAMVDAAEPFDYRLPELIAGFPRRQTLMPVEYPQASRPQAWATG
ncbi:MAG: amylo-alpha-1,6-glucosidase, partial [Actinomycetota bacterium]|nr:amylo-alpha-1,6-glucosidase [Actinomycetota bacterium]